MILKKPDGRFLELDLLRGFAIILMVIFHFIYDLNHVGVIYYRLWEGPFDYTSKSIASIFFLLVGISLTITYNKAKNKAAVSQVYKRLMIRGAKLLSFGLIITIVSYLVIPERFVIFGVLHCIGVSVILAIPFLRYKVPNIVLGVVLILAGLYLRIVTFEHSLLIPIGFIPSRYVSIDFFPLLPWFGVILLGLALGNYLYPDAQRRFHLDLDPNGRLSKKLCFLGRHSLHVYFIHQPVLFAFIFLLLL
ncbi:MAG: heparan-alpha-glucosaminide N-acetyltransferase [Candidatus Thermoplasmatota archaeon]|nr:heparan-alpha-glucosaminide N-acetyltransferase [Candidatus Thermoplasmatota archaeon]